MSSDEFLTVQEALQLLGLSPQVIHDRVKKKLIESEEDASGQYLIPRREVDRVLKIEAEKQAATRQIIELYQSGASLRDVGRKFGLTRQGVRHRLIVAGIPRRYDFKRKLARERISKQLLEKLYFDGKLPLTKIAAEFSVGISVIERVLKFYQIPKRQPLEKGGYIVDALRSLKIGEKDTIKVVNKSGKGAFDTTAKRLGIKLSVKKLDVNNFEITRIG